MKDMALGQPTSDGTLGKNYPGLASTGAGAPCILSRPLNETSANKDSGSNKEAKPACQEKS
jgi:hypothetical protein